MMSLGMDEAYMITAKHQEKGKYACIIWWEKWSHNLSTIINVDVEDVGDIQVGKHEWR